MKKVTTRWERYYTRHGYIVAELEGEDTKLGITGIYNHEDGIFHWHHVKMEEIESYLGEHPEIIMERGSSKTNCCGMYPVVTIRELGLA